MIFRSEDLVFRSEYLVCRSGIGDELKVFSSPVVVAMTMMELKIWFVFSGIFMKMVAIIRIFA